MKLLLGWYPLMMFDFFIQFTAGTETFCYGDSEFKSYTSPLLWWPAMLNCRDTFSGSLAKVNSTDHAKKILEMMPNLVQASRRIHVGANRSEFIGDFRWVDGTDISGDFNLTEPLKNLRCLIINLIDIPQFESNSCIDTSYPYICEREKSLPTIKDGTKIITSSYDSITCETERCSPTWISKDREEIASCEQTTRVCQSVSSSESRLYFNGALESDSGIYHCETQTDPSSFQTVDVKIHGKPKVRNIVTSLCSSTATLKWTPSRYAVNYTHIITLSDGQSFKTVPGDSNTEQSFIMTTLLASTQYTLNISTCNGTCISQFSPATMTFTTNGTPNRIQSIRSNLENVTECSITWTSTYVSKYKIKTTESPITFRTAPRYDRSWDQEVQAPPFIFKVKSNTKYSVSIAAVDCFGTGHFTEIVANCTIPSAAPEDVSSPEVLKGQFIGFPEMRVSLPSESAGLISCILVIVTMVTGDSPTASDTSNKYSIDEFESLFSSNSASKEYVTMALSPSRFVNSEPHFKFVVGEGSTSACNLTDTSTTTLPENTCQGYVMCGTNKKLQNLTRYSVYISAVVPSQSSMLSVTRSEYVNFETGGLIETETGNTELQAIIIVSGLEAVVILVLVIMVLWLRRKLRSLSSLTSHDMSRTGHRDSPPEPDAGISSSNAPPMPPPSLPLATYENMRSESHYETPTVYPSTKNQNTSQFKSREMQCVKITRLEKLQSLDNRNSESKTDEFFNEYQGQYTFLHKLILKKCLYENMDYLAGEFQKRNKELLNLTSFCGPKILEEIGKQFEHFEHLKPMREAVQRVL